MVLNSHHIRSDFPRRYSLLSPLPIKMSFETETKTIIAETSVRTRDEEILPFWRRIFMSAQARRKWAAEHAAYHEDPSSVTLLGEVPTHKSYRLDHGHFNLPPWARTSRQIVVGILVLTLSLLYVFLDHTVQGRL